MTTKEKLIVKQLGYSAYVIYSYIKANPTFANKEIEWDLGMSKESRFRGLKKLYASNIVTVNKRSNRTFTIVEDTAWKL